MKKEQLLEVRRAGDIKRYHLHRTIGEQTVASHSWGVAMLVYALCEAPSANLIKAVLCHDIAERAVGDIPSPVKKLLTKEAKDSLDEMEQIYLDTVGISWGYLTEYEKEVLNVADILEGMLYCLDQVQLGNLNMVSIYKTSVSYLFELTEGNTKLRRSALDVLDGASKEISSNTNPFIRTTT
jgi:5'-deoxynucleotidase YfbR-like HD superfamily hydrolase